MLHNKLPSLRISPQENGHFSHYQCKCERYDCLDVVASLERIVLYRGNGSSVMSGLVCL